LEETVVAASSSFSERCKPGDLLTFGEKKISAPLTENHRDSGPDSDPYDRRQETLKFCGAGVAR
jgi:hypothetical protein